MDDVKKAYAWQEAIKLSQQLVAVCEEFRDPEANVLVWHLRQAAIDIPAGIAADLQGGGKVTMDSMVKLATTLELVRRIYPGIETGDAEARFEKLWQRMAGKQFSERELAPEAEEKNEEDEAVASKSDGAGQPTAVEVAVADGEAAKDQE